jgi:hypothetical protein
MINHILQMLGNRSEVLPRRLTTRRSWRCLPSKKDEKFLPRAVPVGSIDQYFSTVELQACVFLLGMRDVRAVSCHRIVWALLVNQERRGQGVILAGLRSSEM